jgi:hypothetical protein
MLRGFKCLCSKRRCSKGFLKLKYLKLEDFVPIPANETPRQFLLRLTGEDFEYLEGHSWDEVREAGMMPLILDIIDRSCHPTILIHDTE